MSVKQISKLDKNIKINANKISLENKIYLNSIKLVKDILSEKQIYKMYGLEL